ncbi:transcriptional antiterminator [Paenibacillus phyllosphaerae]|uniref:Transcriptional antiterminator n=1 Tax=Paenibacillus phyllosphaerae TaxID=274593 RepID=A0A7W5AU48_9BACL|nr:PRD domain-containing protein [Paenibacillus phyllosphaerae]MBB3108609.1 transcriptional antiterminator [Paenibacillus phyllosphaerae]
MTKRDAALRIERAINNNVLLVMDDQSKEEFVLMGKGIGFAGKSGETILASDTRIEKRFRLDDPKEMVQYHSLLGDMDPEVIRISEAIIQLITAQLGELVNRKIYFALPSHIQFAIYRLRNGMDIVNPFLYETRMCYKSEYEIARQAAELIGSTFGIAVPDEEIGFLTYHVHSAVTNVPIGQIVKFTNLVNELVEKIEERRAIRISRESIDYIRLITHLRYMVERISQGKRASNPLLDSLHQQMPEAYAQARELAGLMEEQLSQPITEDEIGFLAIHLYRLFEVFPSPVTGI